MDPISIVSSSFGLAAAVAKTAMTLTRFSAEFRDCADDLGRICNELQAIAAILEPLSRTLSRGLRSGLPEELLKQVDNTLAGCVSAIDQVDELVQKYQRDKVWTKTKWVIFGQEDMKKLRDSLEFYKMALSLGLHALSLNLGQDIKDDTEILRGQVEEVKVNTNDILARIRSLRDANANRSSVRIERWVEDMAVLSSYAESTYKETLVDPTEFAASPVATEKAPFDFNLGTIEELPAQAADATKLKHERAVSLPTPGALEESFEAAVASTSIGRILKLEIDTTGPVIGMNRIRSTPVIRPSDGSNRNSSPSTSFKSLKIRASSEQLDGSGMTTEKQIVEARKEATEQYKKRRANSENFVKGISVPFDKELDKEESFLSRRRKPIGILANISLRGMDDIAEEVKLVAAAVHRKSTFIQHSQAQRAGLNEEQRKTVDKQLSQISASTTDRYILDTIARGADPNTATPSPLGEALRLGNNRCLFALLRCGANPNISVKLVVYSIGSRIKSTQTALAFAAKIRNEQAVWALCAAGALVDPPGSAIYCPGCSENESWLQTCATPLLQAIDFTNNDPDKMLRIVRFLLANGADPNSSGCNKAATRGHFVHSPLSTCISGGGCLLDRDASFSVAKLLFKAGAVIQWEKLPQTHMNISPHAFSEHALHNPIYVALRRREKRLILLVRDKIAPSQSQHWANAVSWAAMSKAWDCVDMLLLDPYHRKDYLHWLVVSYMSLWENDFEWEDFCRAVVRVLDKGADPTHEARITYDKARTFGRVTVVTEDVTALNLINCIKTTKSRRQVRKLLSGKK